MRAVSDASSLIHAARVPELWVALQRAFEEMLIPEAVHAEILKGEDIRSPDVPVILGAISEGWVKVIPGIDVPYLPDNLGAGERGATSLITRAGVDWLLMDDQVASTTARLFGLEVRSLAYVIVYLAGKRLIEGSQAKVLLDDLVNSGYFLSSTDYLAIRELLEKVCRKR